MSGKVYTAKNGAHYIKLDNGKCRFVKGGSSLKGGKITMKDIKNVGKKFYSKHVKPEINEIISKGAQELQGMTTDKNIKALIGHARNKLYQKTGLSVRKHR